MYTPQDDKYFRYLRSSLENKLMEKHDAHSALIGMEFAHVGDNIYANGPINAHVHRHIESKFKGVVDAVNSYGEKYKQNCFETVRTQFHTIHFSRMPKAPVEVARRGGLRLV